MKQHRVGILVFSDVEVLDTPGVLRDPALLNRRKPSWMLLNLLPYDSALREEAVDLLRERLTERAWRKLQAYYKIPEQHFRTGSWLELLESIAVRRGRKGESEEDIDRTARQLLRDFQRGRFGRLSLEDPATAQVTSPLFSAPANWETGEPH